MSSHLARSICAQKKFARWQDLYQHPSAGTSLPIRTLQHRSVLPVIENLLTNQTACRHTDLSIRYFGSVCRIQSIPARRHEAGLATASGPSGQQDCYRNGFKARWMMKGCDRGTGWSNARNVSWSSVCVMCTCLHVCVRSARQFEVTINCSTCSPFHLCPRYTRLVQAFTGVCINVVSNPAHERAGERERETERSSG